MTSSLVSFAPSLDLKAGSAARVAYCNLVYAYYRDGEGVTQPG
jgi:hypothetical protein